MDLTYTQYIAMMVFWDEKKLSAKELRRRLHLDSGTLTPVLKSLEKKGYVKRTRSDKDERVLLMEITPSGEALKERAADIPAQVAGCVRLDTQAAMQLHRLLYQVLDALRES